MTHWSKLGTAWEGMSLDTLLAEVETSAGFALASSYGGYTNIEKRFARSGDMIGCPGRMAG